jgi:hypothetical protein
MEPSNSAKKRFAAVALLLAAALLCGCPTAEQPKSPKPEPNVVDAIKKAEKPKVTEETVTKSEAPPVAKPAEQPAAKPVEKPVEKAAEKPVEKAAEKPVEKAPDKVATYEVNDLVRKTAEKPTAETKKSTQGKTEPELKLNENGDLPSPEELQKMRKEHPEEEVQPPKKVDLGQPLVDNMDDLKKLDANSPAWIDVKNKQVVLLGESCKATYMLEFLATSRAKDYESVLVVDTKPSIIHPALLALGAVPGHPVKFEPEYSPPTGTEILIELRWKDNSGKVQSTPAQNWVRNAETKKALDVNWVFAGSALWKDPETGKNTYLADHGDFICVLNLPTAMLDLPIRSGGGLESRQFEGFVENMPPAHTPVTIFLKPKLEKKSQGK